MFEIALSNVAMVCKTNKLLINQKKYYQT